MHEASASALDDRGEGTLSPSFSPSPPPLPNNNPIRTLIPNNVSNKPTSISIPATHFEQFQRSIQDPYGPTIAAPDYHNTTDDLPLHGKSTDTLNMSIQDHTIMKASNSSNVSHHKSTFTPTRPQLPTLINKNVSELCESRMEVDLDCESSSRKRTLSSISSESQQIYINKKKPSKNELSNPKISPTDSNQNKKLTYSNSDQPPYIVHVYSNNNNIDPQIEPMHPLLISRTLSKIAYSEIKEIKKIGRGKILAEMTSAKAANNLVLNPTLLKDNLIAFIPSYRTIRTGVVRDIPQYFDDSNLLEFFDSPFKVIEVKRLNRRTKIDGEIKYIPSRTVCIKFAGQILPKYIFLCRNRYEVHPYITKVKICFSCHRIGHISKNCKSKPRCLFCGNDAHEPPSVCPNKDDNPLCINCKGEHLANSRNCPLIIRHRMVLSLAASENIPLIEAKRKILQSTSIPRDITYDYVNFPMLNSPRSSHNSNFNNSPPQCSQIYSPNVPHFNRFATLDTLNDSPNSSENSPPSFNTLFQSSFKNKKQTSVQTTLHNRDNHFARLNKSPQKVGKINTNYNFNAHRNLLYAPNGRLPNFTNYGSGYSAPEISNSKPGTNNPPCTGNNNQETLPQHMYKHIESGYVGDAFNNVNITSLNNVFSSLTQNLECIYHMIRSSCSSSSVVTSSPSHPLPTNNGQEQ